MNKAIAISALTSTLVTAGVAVMLTHGAQEVVQIPQGTVIQPRFSIHTDSILSVVGTTIVPKSCGVGTVYLRLWNGTQQLSADTITVNVTCPVPTPDTVAKVSMCRFPNTDSLAKYKVNSDTTIDPRLVPCTDSLVSSALFYLPKYRTIPKVIVTDNHNDYSLFDSINGNSHQR